MTTNIAPGTKLAVPHWTGDGTSAHVSQEALSRSSVAVRVLMAECR
jgi:hypothetical protein